MRGSAYTWPFCESHYQAFEPTTYLDVFWLGRGVIWCNGMLIWACGLPNDLQWIWKLHLCLKLLHRLCTSMFDPTDSLFALPEEVDSCRFLTPYRSIHVSVLLGDQQALSRGELINLRFDPFSTLILPLFSYNLSTNLSKKGVEYTFLTYYALSCPISWSAGLRSRKWEFPAGFAKNDALGSISDMNEASTKPRRTI